MKYDVWTSDGNTKRGEVRLPQTFWSRLLDQRDRLVESLRHKLRQWLGIGRLSVDVHDAITYANSALSKCGELRQQCDGFADRFATLDAGMERLNASDDSLEKLIASTAQDLQGQISDIFSPDGPIAQARPITEEPVQMHAGHVRFSDRKRQYEAEHRRPIFTEAGKQIAENARIIASGTRKSDDKS